MNDFGYQIHHIPVYMSKFHVALSDEKCSISSALKITMTKCLFNTTTMQAFHCSVTAIND